MSDPKQPLPGHVTTPLLSLITARSMDEDYAHVAAQRADLAQDVDNGRRWASLSTLLVIASFGALIAIAASQSTRDAQTNELGREALIDRIQARRTEVVELQGQINNLKMDNQAAVGHAVALQTQADNLDEVIERVAVPAGFVAVRGEGIRITVDSSPQADTSDEVRDEDLATLVDGLWHAGAEAIAINDERLNAAGGIRNTGRAIHVNGRPVNAPYQVSAIGNSGTLEARLLASSQGQVWFTLVDGLDFRYSVQKIDDLRLPSAPIPVLRDVIEFEEAPNGKPTGEDAAP